MDLEKLDMIYFHDARILKYEKKDNDVVLYLYDEYCYNIYKITLKNTRINEDINSKIAFDLMDVIGYIDTGEISIFNADYNFDENNKYHFKLELVGIPGFYKYYNSILDEKNYQVICSDEYYGDNCPTMSFIADDIIVEEILKDNKLIDKYNKNSAYYKNNYDNISKYLDKNVIDFLDDFYLFSYACYDDEKNILLYFRDDYSNPDKCVYLKLIDAKIEILENDINEDFVLENKIHCISNCNDLRISIDDNGLYEIGLLISQIREIVIKCSDIKCYEYDYNKLIDNIKLNGYEKINYHDADIYNYKRDGKNISFELNDGWDKDIYYKFELKNVMVQVMNNKTEYINYVLDEFNNINEYGNINLYSGECGLLDEPINEYKYYLKLWIRHPGDLGIKTDVETEDYKFDGLDIVLCDDYDDTGRLYIKFIVEDINVIELYPLLKKYSRNSLDNMNNLYKYKDKFGEKEFKFFSVYDTGFYIYYDLEYIDNNICITCRNMLDLNDEFTIKFLNIYDKLNKEDLNIFISNMIEKKNNYCECIRIIKCVNDKYVVGFLKSNEDEIVFSCDEIIYEGKLLDFKSMLDEK